MDRIYIRDLALRCVIGIYPEERREKQDVIVNVTLDCDCAPAAASDRIEDAVDYKAIKRGIVAEVESSQHRLIERMASRIADLCLKNPKVRRATVCVDKPGALRFARSVAVEVVREQPAVAPS